MTNCLVQRVELTGATPLPTLSRKGRGRNNQLLAMTLRLIQRYWVQATPPFFLWYLAALRAPSLRVTRP